MFEKLEALLKRYEEIRQLLTEDDVLSDRLRCSRLAKELSSIELTVERYKEYKRFAAEIEDAKNILAKESNPDFIEMIESEIEDLDKKKQEIGRELEDAAIEEDKEAGKNVIMEIRAGTGGLEASLFAGDLFRMYSKYAARQGWKIEIMDSHLAEKGGFKEIIFLVKGKDVFKDLKYERGVHRVQRVPVTESSGRIHTSAVTVAVLPEAEDVEVNINPQDLKIDTFRSSGAGGQHVNVTDSAVRITHIPTGIVVQCQNERSQHKNKIAATKVLKARILEGLKREHEEKTASDRKKQVGSGDRSEKIRTYNFPDRRVTDHRISLTIHKLDDVMEGELDEIIRALKLEEKRLRLEQ